MIAFDTQQLERARSNDTPIRVAALARVKNECDIIEAFVRHHVRLVDHLVVVDNASFDGTREILELLRAEGLPLTVLDDTMLDFRQSAIMTYLARRTLSALRCERLFLLDADEFLKVGSKDELEAALALLPADHHGLLPAVTYVMTPADTPGDCVPVRLGYRRAGADGHFKVVLSRSFLHQPDAIVAAGNHSVASLSPMVRSAVLADLVLAHYPMRSLEQIQIKVAMGWGAFVASGYEAPWGLGSHWRRLFDLLVEDPSAFAAAIYENARNYQDDGVESVALVRDPMPWHVELRYSQRAKPSVVSTLARSNQEIARAYARMRAAVDRSTVEVNRAMQARNPAAEEADGGGS